MHTRFVTGLLVAALCAVPLAASALSADDVQARIQDLLSKVSALTAQIRALQETPATATPSAAPPQTAIKSRVCSVLGRNLQEGSRGEDVSGLQEFLRSLGLLTVDPTGYFGALTRNALARWQVSHGIVASIEARAAGAGMLGPRTRAGILAWCGESDTVPAQQFSATPQRGEAPLAVTFSTWISAFHVPAVSYLLDYGDGTSEKPADCSAPADACVAPGTNTHTYASNGTYTATLVRRTDPCAGNTACRAAIQSETIGRLTITVGTACTQEYQPVCALKPVVCIKAPCNPVPRTYSNACLAAADGATYAYAGECRNASADPSADPQCKSWYDGCNSCARSAPGGPAMCTLKACIPESTGPAYCTGRFGDATHQAPSISGFSGPTRLAANETGTWTVQASDPEGQALSYYIAWGDEAQYTASGIRTSLPVFTQSTTFTHAYSQPGTYTVRVTARNDAGKEAEVSITVSVSGNATVCTDEYAPICGRPAGCANTCAAGEVCTAICRLYDPLTYSNRCYLAAANAQYLYDGECR